MVGTSSWSLFDRHTNFRVIIFLFSGFLLLILVGLEIELALFLPHKLGKSLSYSDRGLDLEVLGPGP